MINPQDARELKNIDISGESDQYYNFLCMNIYNNYPHKENKFNQVKVITVSPQCQTLLAH